MSKSKSPTEWLDEISEELALNYDHRNCPNECMGAQTYAEAKQAILNHVEAIVNQVIEVSRPVIYNKGAKPIGGIELTDFYCKAREDLRVEQHTKKRQLLKGKD